MRHSRTLVSLSLLSTCLLLFASATVRAESPEKLRDVKPEEISKITDAMPAKPVVAAKSPRKMLVFWRCEGFFHGSIPVANKALEIMGKKRAPSK